ncbi:MAG: hypothetical protein FGM18_00670 [Burkholderiaceae bacterium]|nr:hypothetical protein [Burkholderiaceae bacterium]
MASMQVLGGSSAAAASAGQAGAVDPLMAGFSAEAVAAAAGQAGSGTPENQFAGEFAAALAALEAQQAAAMAQSLSDQILPQAQAATDAALLMANGQNLPFDPAFQGAVMATFAAVNGAVQDGVAVVDAATLAAAQMAANGVSQLAADASIESATGITVSAPSASELALLAETPEALVGAESGAVAAVVVDESLTSEIQPAQVTEGSDQNPVIATAALTVQTSVQADAPAVTKSVKASVEAVDDAASVQNAGAAVTGMTQNGTTGSTPVSANVASGVAVSNNSAQAHSGGADASADHPSQQQSSQSAALAAAAASKSQQPVVEISKENSAAGDLAGDVGNVVVVAKANAEGVAAAAETARQSAQRVDATTGTAAAQSAESARTESRLEATRASLGSGPLNVEVLKLTKQGGGRAVLEVTPPNQGPIRLDLQLDGAGRASLVVEGLTDAMKARLESSAHFLRQDMAQMGLALNLEMRERNDSNSAAQAFDQGQFGRSGGNGSRERDGGRSSSLTTVAGSAPNARGSITADDGIHLVA